MKNKKLLKTVLCIASGIGFATSIPFLTTSCGSSSIKLNPLPEEVYDIDSNGILNSFTADFLTNPNAYSKYNTMKIPARVTGIFEWAFDGDIPDFVKNLHFAKGSNCSSIGDGAFNNCSSLTTVDLSNCANLSSIGSDAFLDCTSLTSIDLSKCTNLSSISTSGFQECNSIKDIKIDNDYYHVEQLGPKGKAVIAGKNGQTSWNSSSIVVGNLACGDIEIPDNITSIGREAFFACSSITSVNFPSGLTTIGENSFAYCKNITSITFSSNLNSINNAAFNMCQSLNYIAWDLPNNYDSIVSINQNVFSSISSTGKVKSLNPSIGSGDFLAWIKTKGNFPSSGWEAEA